MNERIQQLLLQVVPMAGEDGEYLPSLHTPEDIEKFAEMIVKECALTLESITVPVLDYNPDFDNGYNKALLTGSAVIKQHFGVGRMSKITTADCKKFLVKEITNNPIIVLDIYGGFDRPGNLLPTALVEKNWVRSEKFKPTGEHYRVEDSYRLWFPLKGPGRGEVPAETLAAIRVFHLDPGQFDDSVGFMVLEDHAGNLVLGEYIGD